jgi:hypothetical protein
MTDELQTIAPPNRDEPRPLNRDERRRQKSLDRNPRARPKASFRPENLDDDQLLNRQELADWVGFTMETICRFDAESRGPPYIKIGGRYRYRVGDVKLWLKQQEKNS